MKSNMLTKKILAVMLAIQMGATLIPSVVYGQDDVSSESVNEEKEEENDEIIEEDGPTMNDDVEGENETELIQEEPQTVEDVVESTAPNNQTTINNDQPTETNEETVSSNYQSSIAEKRWDISKGKDRSKTGNYTIPSETTRFEVFYNKDALAPEITFVTTSGFLYKTTQDVYTDPVTGARYETRRGNQVGDYSDMAYMVIYITKPSDPGLWKINIDLDDDTDTFLMVKTEVPNDFMTLVKEYKMYVIDTVIWAIDSSKADYKLSNLVDMAAAEKRPEENDIKDTEPPVQEKTDPLVYVIIFLVIAIIGFTVFIILNIKSSNNTKEEISKKKVKNANKKYKKKKSKENDYLDDLMEQYNDDYSDDEFNNNSNNDEFEDDSQDFENKPEHNTRMVNTESYTGVDRRDINHVSEIPGEGNHNLQHSPYQYNQSYSENPQAVPNSRNEVKGFESYNELPKEKAALNEQTTNIEQIPYIERAQNQEGRVQSAVSVKEIPSWMPQEEKKTPKWMEEDDDNDNFF